MTTWLVLAWAAILQAPDFAAFGPAARTEVPPGPLVVQAREIQIPGPAARIPGDTPIDPGPCPYGAGSVIEWSGEWIYPGGGRRPAHRHASGLYHVAGRYDPSRWYSGRAATGAPDLPAPRIIVPAAPIRGRAGDRARQPMPAFRSGSIVGSPSNPGGWSSALAGPS